MLLWFLSAGCLGWLITNTNTGGRVPQLGKLSKNATGVAHCKVA